MTCGSCARRMRQFILPKVGYTLQGETWVHPEKDPIADADVARHYSALTMELLTAMGEQTFKAWWETMTGAVTTARR